MSYATVAQLKEAVGIPSSDTSLDTPLQAVLNSADLMINQYCGVEATGFTVSSSVVRYYTAPRFDYCLIDNAVTVTQVAIDIDGDGTYSQVWAGTDWVLAPRNAAADGKPYYEIDVTPNGTKNFGTNYNGVKVTGTWGWPGGAPAGVIQAAILIASQLWASRTAPFGAIGGGGDMGGTTLRLTRSIHPSAAALLEGYRRREGLAY
jgi:hypothetical protein